MPVISFASSKGGAGKSTSALLLATELAEGADVVLVDADPRRPIAAWSRDAALPTGLTVISSNGVDTIQDEIDQAARRAPFVIVDLEGIASRLGSYAMAESDLVIVACQEQHQDAQAALETLGEVRRVGRAGRREIAACVALTRTKAAVKGRTSRHVAGQLRAIKDIYVLKTEVHEREPYAAMWSTATSIRSLDPREVNGLPRAIENAAAFAEEIVILLQSKSVEAAQ